jgi:hypothetical protein
MLGVLKRMFGVGEVDDAVEIDASAAALASIRESLFPPFEYRTVTNGDGETVRYAVDDSVDSIIESVIADLESGYNDETIHRSLTDVLRRLDHARRVLRPEQGDFTDQDYVVVGTPVDDSTVHVTDVKVAD